MFKILSGLALIVSLAACSKDNFNSTPEITYKSIDGNFVDGTRPISSIDPEPGAIVNFTITDKEGDIGITDEDTAFIYIKSLLTGAEDSLIFPNLRAVTKKDFKADVSAFLVPTKRPNPGGAEVTDTVFYEVYVRDFKRNKSNVIRTEDPIYFKYR